MKVLSYYEPIWDAAKQAHEERCIAVWRESWETNGWEPVLLGPTHAMAHPRHDELMAKFATYPTPNNKQYELAVFRRHLAYANHLMDRETVAIVDYDVVNLYERPDLFDPMYNQVPCGIPYSIHQRRSICAYVTNGDGQRWFLDLMARFDLSTAKDPSYIGDMNIAADSRIPMLAPLCNEGLYKDATMIHVSTGTANKMRMIKANLMEVLWRLRSHADVSDAG